jgi:hypothetical protein
MTYGIRAPHIGFGHVHSSHAGVGYHPHHGFFHPCRHTFYHARTPADHPHYRPLTHHWNNLLRLCFSGHGHAGR